MGKTSTGSPLISNNTNLNSNLRRWLKTWKRKNLLIVFSKWPKLSRKKHGNDVMKWIRRVSTRIQKHSIKSFLKHVDEPCTYYTERVSDISPPSIVFGETKSPRSSVVLITVLQINEVKEDRSVEVESAWSVVRRSWSWHNVFLILSNSYRNIIPWSQRGKRICTKQCRSLLWNKTCLLATQSKSLRSQVTIWNWWRQNEEENWKLDLHKVESELKRFYNAFMTFLCENARTEQKTKAEYNVYTYYTWSQSVGVTSNIVFIMLTITYELRRIWNNTMISDTVCMGTHQK